MGDQGFLTRLKVQVARPGLYGDLTTYAGRVTAKDEAAKTVTLDINGTTRDGTVNTRGSAEVTLPSRA